MQKLSLYDLLSVLLPGAILTLVIEFIGLNFGIEVSSSDLNEYFTLTLFLSSSIFLGSIINISTRNLLNLYKFIGLYTPLSQIYSKSLGLVHIKPFFQNILDSFTIDFSKNDNDSIENIEKRKLEHLWSIIYYELEAKEDIGAPKAFQSFYFFFRNFFTLGIILFFPLLFLMINKHYEEQYLLFFVFNLISILLSIPAARWNRKQMTERMFWTYYSLNKVAKK
jgi:hypothetical protein